MGQKGQGQAAHPSHVEPEVGSRAVESLKFFVDRGQSQTIAGYYDVDDLTNFQQRDAAARQVKGVAGFMYTTWQAKYGLLERYGEAIGAAPNLDRTSIGAPGSCKNQLSNDPGSGKKTVDDT